MTGVSNWRNLAAACSAITVFGLAFGMTYPLLSLILESRGVSTEMIGLNSAMMPIGILLFSWVIPVITRRFGSRNVAIWAALGTSGLILAYKMFDSLEAWFVIRLLHGMTMSTLFVLSEAWIVGFAGNLVNLVYVDNTALGPFHVVVGVLQQRQDDILDIFTHVTGLGEAGGIGNGKRHI